MRGLIDIVLDDDRSLQERAIVIMAVIALSAMFIMVFVGIALGESFFDIATLAAGFVVLTVMAYFAIKHHKTQIIAPIAGVIIIFFVLPVTFVTGGGLLGGSPLWFVFCVLFVCMLVTGVLKYILLFLSFIVAGFCYYFTYKYPDLMVVHDTKSAYVDSFISLVLVCFMLTFMITFEIWLLNRQRKISDEKAKEVEALNRAQNSFFSNMSHEIRTPVNTIIGLNEVILRENVSEEINENALNIQSAGRMLLHLINDILDMSKFESGQMELNEASYHTGDMLSEIVDMFWIKAKEKNLLFFIDVSQNLPSQLRGDEVRIKQILINLINNAIKYTQKGEVRLSVQCEKDKNGLLYVIYSVSDTGMGIKNESIPHLFDAFRRVDEDVNKYIEGTGLGLSIVKQLTDLMGGKISVNSVYTKGSTFVVELPQEIVDEEPLGDFDPERKHRSGQEYAVNVPFEAPKAKVLVVDDTTANLMVVEKLLKNTKVLVDTASSGQKALEMTMKKAYHLILMDHKMSGMDGIECMHAIKEQAGGLSQKSMIVALTANVGSDVEAMYENEGFDGYLTKPVTGEALENTVLRFLPKDIVNVYMDAKELEKESKAWINAKGVKKSTLITTESVADIPGSLLQKYNIDVLPHLVKTSCGLFKDGVEIETTGLLSYMEKKANIVETAAPSVEDHVAFFAQKLKEADNIIHVAISQKVANSGYPAALAAASNFGNVFAVDSEHLSMGQGFMAIEAARLAKEGRKLDEIILRLENMKRYIHTSFIVDSLEFLSRQKQVSSRVARLFDAFMAHPVIVLKKGHMKISGIYFGGREKSRKKYISSVFKGKGTIDTRTLFIIHVGLDVRELEKIKLMALKQVPFNDVIIQKASPAIAANCGAGSFGLLFLSKAE